MPAQIAADELQQSGFRRSRGRYPQLIRVEDTNDGSESISDVFCTATFQHKSGDGEDLRADAAASTVSAGASGTPPVASSPNITPSAEPINNLRAAGRQTSASNVGWISLTNPLTTSSMTVPRRYSSSVRPGTRQRRTRLSSILLEGEDGTKWPDGSEWVSLVEAGYSQRHRGSIRYALTAIAFARWHASQVRLIDSTTYQKAAQEVSGRVLGPKPGDDETKKGGWERRRKNIGTHLTRGQKWSRLVKELSTVILLKNAW